MRRWVAACAGTAVVLLAALLLVVQPAGAAHLRTKNSSPLKVSLVPAYGPCVAPDRQHGPPLAFPSCSSPQQVSSRLTAGNPPSQAAQFAGHWSVFPRPGTPGLPEDARALLLSSIVDVRCGAPSAGCPIAGADYAGEVEVRITMRISDHYNAVAPGGGTEAATVQDIELAFAIPCAVTSDPDIGATCGYNSDILAYYPGAVKESKRMILEFGQVRLIDGGEDGDASTDDGAETFLTQGVFIP